MHVAIYQRVSTEDQARHGLSLSHQEQTCRDAATRAGATAITVFSDPGCSGTTLRRPALADLRAHLADYACVYVYKLDRLARTVSGFATLMEELASARVGFVSVSEGIDYSTPHGRLTMHMLASVAAYFVDLTKERVNDVIRHRVHDLNLPHGKPPYGYTPGEQRQPWQVVPAEAEVVRVIFRRYAAGDSLHSIARYLNTEGFPRKQQGQMWWVASLHKILANPAYIGEFRFQGETYAGGHEPVVPLRLWQQAQARLRLREGLETGNAVASLSPLYRCGECGGPTRCANKVRRYFCSWRIQAPDPHPPISVPAAKAEAAVWAYTNLVIQQGTLTDALADHRASAAAKEDSKREDVIRRRLRAIDHSLAVNLRAAQVGAIREDMLREENAPLLAEQGLLEEELSRLAPAGDYGQLAGYLARLNVETFARRASQAPTDTQLGFLLRLYDRVEVWQDRVVIHHRAPLPPATIHLPKFYFPKRGVPGAFVLDDGETLFW